MKRILLPVDLFHPTGWEAALEHALLLAEHHDAELHLLTVIPSFGMPMVAAYFPQEFSTNASKEAEVEMAKFADANVPTSVKSVKHVKHGTIYKEIIAEAAQLGVDMIVMASHRPEMKDYLLGPNAARVVRHAKCSVTIIR